MFNVNSKHKIMSMEKSKWNIPFLLRTVCFLIEHYMCFNMLRLSIANANSVYMFLLLDYHRLSVTDIVCYGMKL